MPGRETAGRGQQHRDEGTALDVTDNTALKKWIDDFAGNGGIDHFVANVSALGTEDTEAGWRKAIDVPDAVIEEIEATWLREAIRRLPQKARYVLVRRYGLDDWDTLTLAELASELKLSRERVRQLQREAEFLLKSGTKRVPRPSVA